MKFWRIKHPDYHSDYRNSYINGELEHPFGLPGVNCDICGNTWGGSRMLSFTCPDTFRHHKNIIKRWPISRSQHEKLQRELMTALSIKGEPFLTFRPGDSFQPCFLNVPSRPVGDFLWPTLSSLVVSERIKNILMSNWPDDIIACPITPRKIGRRDAKLSPPRPSTGEPEDIINEVPLEESPRLSPAYFEILIQKRSACPADMAPGKICSGCKLTNPDRSPMNIVLTPDMWNGNGIFYLWDTYHIFVTDDVRKVLMSVQASNVVFEQVRTPQ